MQVRNETLEGEFYSTELTPQDLLRVLAARNHRNRIVAVATATATKWGYLTPEQLGEKIASDIRLHTYSR